MSAVFPRVPKLVRLLILGLVVLTTAVGATFARPSRQADAASPMIGGVRFVYTIDLQVTGYNFSPGGAVTVYIEGRSATFGTRSLARVTTTANKYGGVSVIASGPFCSYERLAVSAYDIVSGQWTVATWVIDNPTYIC